MAVKIFTLQCKCWLEELVCVRWKCCLSSICWNLNNLNHYLFILVRKQEKNEEENNFGIIIIGSHCYFINICLTKLAKIIEATEFATCIK